MTKIKVYDYTNAGNIIAIISGDRIVSENTGVFYNTAGGCDVSGKMVPCDKAAPSEWLKRQVHGDAIYLIDNE